MPDKDADLDELRAQTQKGNRLDDAAPTSFKEDVAAALDDLEKTDDQPMLSIYDENLRAFMEALEADEQREAAFRDAVADAAGRSDETSRRSPLLANLLRVGIMEVDADKWDAAKEAATDRMQF